MHIVNVMFGRGLGGIEQTFVDYCQALHMHSHKVSCMVYPNAPITKSLKPLNTNIIGVKNLGQWDIFAKFYIKKILKQLKPDAIIVHGNRAIHLMRPAAEALNIPIIGVAHNNQIKHLVGLTHVFTTTKRLYNNVIAMGVEEAHVTRIPNMLHVQTRALKPQRIEPPFVIGAMGRFVTIKGFHTFIEAIAILVKRGLRVQGIIGGAGSEEKVLKRLAKERGVEFKVSFQGWVDDKEAFFEKIDIFCLPSIQEAFGIVLLEAFAHAKPVVTTDAQGPSEIVQANRDALVVPKENPHEMAAAIEKLMNNQSMMHQMSRQGYATVQQYSIEQVAKQIDLALKGIV